MGILDNSFLIDVILSVVLIIFSFVNLKYYWFGTPEHNLFLLILNFLIIIFNSISVIRYFSKKH